MSILNRTTVMKCLRFDCLNRILKAEKTLPWGSTFVRMLAYIVQTAVVIKTQLEVPDNRLCNVVTLSDLPNSDEASFALCGQSVTIKSR